MLNPKCLLLISIIILFSFATHGQETYAEKLGFPKGAKVLILHVDDAGMSYDSNEGAIMAIDKGRGTTATPGTDTPFGEVMFPLSEFEMVLVRP